MWGVLENGRGEGEGEMGGKGGLYTVMIQNICGQCGARSCRSRQMVHAPVPLVSVSFRSNRYLQIFTFEAEILQAVLRNVSE